MCVPPLLPIVTLPKSRLVGFAASIPGANPVPERVMVAGELVALLTTVTVPVALPATVGANVTAKVALCPLGNVAGTGRPLMLNPAPLTVTWDIVIFVAAVLLIVIVSTSLLPTARLPKLTVVGFAAKLPGPKALPVRSIAVGELAALLTILRLPLAVPVTVGANFKLTVAL